MKLMANLLSLLLLLTLTIFTSCKKDPDYGMVVDPVTKIPSEELAGTYTVTNVILNDNYEVDLGDQRVTLKFEADKNGKGGNFTSVNAGNLPGDDDLPASGSWVWKGLNFTAVTIGATTLNFTSALGANPTFFTYTARDAKGNFTVTVTADKN